MNITYEINTIKEGYLVVTNQVLDENIYTLRGIILMKRMLGNLLSVLSL